MRTTIGSAILTSKREKDASRGRLDGPRRGMSVVRHNLPVLGLVRLVDDKKGNCSFPRSKYAPDMSSIINGSAEEQYVDNVVVATWSVPFNSKCRIDLSKTAKR